MATRLNRKAAPPAVGLPVPEKITSYFLSNAASIHREIDSAWVSGPISAGKRWDLSAKPIENGYL
jgi:hypothetical protein